MCLRLKLHVPASERARLEEVVAGAPSDGLRVELLHAPIWPWARRRDAEARVSEQGGCACSLLAEAWSMRPEILEPLARTLSALAEAGPEGMIVEALWQGETPERERSITAAELAGLARRSQLGTRTRYLLSRQPRES
jgi:hypothetical protein